MQIAGKSARSDFDIPIVYFWKQYAARRYKFSIYKIYTASIDLCDVSIF